MLQKIRSTLKVVAKIKIFRSILLYVLGKKNFTTQPLIVQSPVANISLTTVPINRTTARLSYGNVNLQPGFAEFINLGGYCETLVSGTTQLQVKQDLSNFVAASATVFPQVTVTVDDGVPSVITLGSSTVLANNLDATKSHKVKFFVSNVNSNQPSWVNPCYPRITEFQVDAGGSCVATPSEVLNVLFIGDSIAGGYNGVAVDVNDSYSTRICDYIGGEYGIIAHGGQGWVAKVADFGNTADGTPAFKDAYSYLYQGVPLPLNPLPDMVFINMGTNDQDNDITSIVSAFLPAARALFGGNCQIFLMVPPNRKLLTYLTNVFNSYKASSTDNKIYLVIADPRSSLGLDGGIAFPNLYSLDGTHPTAWNMSRLSGYYIGEIQKILTEVYKG